MLIQGESRRQRNGTRNGTIESCRGYCESKERDIRENGKCSGIGEKGKK